MCPVAFAGLKRAGREGRLRPARGPRATGGKPEPAAAPAFPYQTPPPRGRAPAAEHAVGPERLEVAPTPDVVAKALLCEELQEVIRGVDAALQTPQSPAATEQLNARRRAYVEKRMALGC